MKKSVEGGSKSSAVDLAKQKRVIDRGRTKEATAGALELKGKGSGRKIAEDVGLRNGGKLQNKSGGKLQNGDGSKAKNGGKAHGVATARAGQPGKKAARAKGIAGSSKRNAKQGAVRNAPLLPTRREEDDWAIFDELSSSSSSEFPSSLSSFSTSSVSSSLSSFSSSSISSFYSSSSFSSSSSSYSSSSISSSSSSSAPIPLCSSSSGGYDYADDDSGGDAAGSGSNPSDPNGYGDPSTTACPSCSSTSSSSDGSGSCPSGDNPSDGGEDDSSNPSGCGGVRPGTGEALFGICRASLQQVGAGGYNMSFGESRQYSSLGSGSNGVMYGTNWAHPYVPSLNISGDTVMYTQGNAGSFAFKSTESGYKPTYFVQDQLAYNSGADEYTVTKTSGEQQVFSGTGQLKSIADSFGNKQTFSYSGGVLASAVMTDTTGAPSSTVGYHYTFDDSSRLSNAVLRVGGTTSDYDVRQINYTYDSSSNLQTVELQQSTGSSMVTVKNAYFRYHEGTSLMKFAVEDDAFKQMQSIDPTWPAAADDETVAQYADQSFTYDSSNRVTQSSTNGGKYTYGFSYTSSGFGAGRDSGGLGTALDYNTWSLKTTVAHPDGSSHAYHYNSAANLMLKKVVDPDGGTWYPICQQFDENQRVTLKASSEAVASVDESTPGLFTLHPSTGKIEAYQYDGTGNRTQVALQQGASGTPIVTSERTYSTQTVGGVSIYPVASKTVYQTAAETLSSTSAVTTYTPTWMNDSSGNPTFQMASLTTTLPVVSPGENGSGATVTKSSTFDEYGFVTSTVNEVGTTTTHTYDKTSGAVTQTVLDAAVGGLNLTTNFQADSLGRRTQMVGPVHTVPIGGVATAIQRTQTTQYLDDVDHVRTISGHITVSTGETTFVNPVAIQVNYSNDPEVAGGRMQENITATWHSSSIPPDPGYTFPQADYTQWTTRSISPQNELTHSRTYTQIPASGLGVAGTNYAQTNYGYDSAGRPNQTTLPAGTTRIDSFNAMGWLTQTSVGTSPTETVATKVLEYDNGEPGGNGNVTQKTRPVDSNPANDRIINYQYDWRNRVIQTQTNDGTRTIIIQTTYDNLDNAIQSNKYQTAATSENLLSQTQTFFDSLNRIYQTQAFGVDVGGGGTLGPALTSNTYFDAAGRVARVVAGGLVGFTALQYNAVGQPSAIYKAYGGELDLSDPADISTATVMEQVELAYDASNNPISRIWRQRFDDATGVGPLQSPSVQPEARVYYNAFYYDSLGRVVANANFGTNGAASWTRPDATPASSSTILVTSFVYDSAGRLVETTNPMGQTTQSIYDQAGQLIGLIENFQPGSGPGLNINKTTQYAYNDDGNLISQTVINPTTGNQVTQWIYGVTTANGSTVNSNWLVYQKIYPDGSAPSDLVTYSYDQQGQMIRKIDQAGTTHVYSYDLLWRLTSDAVTAFGSGVDSTVQAIGQTYDPRGMLESISSYGSDSTVLNQVLRVFNQFSQLEQEYQEHDGAVDTSTTLKVGYSYADGSANSVRPTEMAYPDDTFVQYVYDSTAAQELSRCDLITDNGPRACSYAYLGLSTFVNVTYDSASGLEWTAETGGTGDAGDQYTALDRFGRLVETLWQLGSTAKVHSKYCRNQNGGIMWREDLIATALSVTTQDNFYWYDGLQQVVTHQRGLLNGTAPNYTGIVSPPQQAEDFGYDSAGNWATSDTLIPANSQMRTHNPANEITSIASSSVSGETPVQYDLAGNMTLAPQPSNWGENYQLTYDAWNRLVEVVDASTSAEVATYGYDGFARRISKVTPEEIQAFYYSSNWQVLQARSYENLPSSSSEVITPEITNFIWGLRGIDDLILRSQATGGESPQQLFALSDQYNVVAISDQTASIQQRYGYDAFGTTQYMTTSFVAEAEPVDGWETTFCGYRFDQETGLYQVRNRYLHPSLGRWISRDPLGERGGINLYGYLLNDPIAFTDPLGLACPARLNGKPSSMDQWNQALKNTGRVEAGLVGAYLGVGGIVDGAAAIGEGSYWAGGFQAFSGGTALALAPASIASPGVPGGPIELTLSMTGNQYLQALGAASDAFTGLGEDDLTNILTGGAFALNPPELDSPELDQDSGQSCNSPCK